MSFLTQPTRVNELSVETVQDHTSNVSLRVASTGSAIVDGSFMPARTFSGVASVDSTQIADGEMAFLVDDQTGGSSSSCTLQFRSGATSYQFAAIDATLR